MPGRLAKALSQDRREGEGGEEDLEQGVDQEMSIAQEKGGEESNDTAEERHERRGIFQAFTPGKLAKAFFKSKINEEKQEMTELDREEEINKDKEEKGDGQHEGEFVQEREESSDRADGHARSKKVNLLKVLQLDRLKKSLAKGDRRDTDSGTCSSVESLHEIGHERKGYGKIPGLASWVMRSSQREMEDETKTEVKEEDDSEEINKKSPDKRDGTVECCNVQTLAEMVKTEPDKVTDVLSRGRSKEEQDRGSGVSDGKRRMNTDEGEGQEEPADVAQSNWRSRKTRKARRLTRGSKIMERGVGERMLRKMVVMREEEDTSKSSIQDISN